MDFSRRNEVNEDLAARLRHWYEVEFRSQSEIGDMLGISEAVVRRLFSECSIRTRSKSEASSNCFRNKPKKNARVTRSCVDCGQSFRISVRSNRERCSRSCSISERNRLQGKKTIAVVEKRFNESLTVLLRRWHWEENKTNKEMAALVGISEHIVLRWFRQFKVPHRNKSEAMRLLIGPKHSGWKGGIRHPYGNDFIETSLQAKMRDKWTCQLCGVKGLPKKHYNSHHIVPFRESRDNSLDNLVTLCVGCHSRAEQAYKRLRGALVFSSSRDLWDQLVIVIGQRVSNAQSDLIKS